MSDDGNKVLRDAVPAHAIVTELVSAAVLLALNLNFLSRLREQYGAGFQPVPMFLAEAVIVLSVCMIVYIGVFVLFRHLVVSTSQGVMWSYIFAAIWARVMAVLAILAVGSGTFSWIASRESNEVVLPGPFLWGFFAFCFALTARARSRQLTAEPFFEENDRRISQEPCVFESRLGFGFVERRKMGLKDIPFALIVMLIIFLVGLWLLVLGIGAAGFGRISALIPLCFGLMFTTVSFYWLAALGSHLRGKPLTLISLMEKKSAAGVAGVHLEIDPMAGQRTILSVLGVLSLVPLGMASVQGTWMEFVFAVVAGQTGFIGLGMMRKRLGTNKRHAAIVEEDWADVRRRFARRGCDYGLILLVGGLLVATVVPNVIAWGTGDDTVGSVWWHFAFPVWAWLMLASLSSWYERATRKLWEDQEEVPPSLKLTETITWPFQVFQFLNPWEVILKLYFRMKNTHD